MRVPPALLHAHAARVNRVRYPHPTELNHTALTYSIYDEPVDLTDTTNVLAHITDEARQALVVSHSGASLPRVADRTLSQSNVLSHVLPLCWT